jgi:hypothetical protein
MSGYLMQLIDQHLLLSLTAQLFCVTSAAAAHLSMPQVSYVSWLLLCVAASLAAWSLAIYFANVWTHFVAPPQVQPGKKAT